VGPSLAVDLAVDQVVDQVGGRLVVAAARSGPARLHWLAHKLARKALRI
jgi:hypothetical protein